MTMFASHRCQDEERLAVLQAEEKRLVAESERAGANPDSSSVKRKIETQLQRVRRDLGEVEAKIGHRTPVAPAQQSRCASPPPRQEVQQFAPVTPAHMTPARDRSPRVSANSSPTWRREISRTPVKGTGLVRVELYESVPESELTKKDIDLRDRLLLNAANNRGAQAFLDPVFP